MTRTTLLTLQELADESGIPVKTLYAMCAPKGDLPCVRRTSAPSGGRRTHGRIWIRRVDWETWLEQHRSAPANERRAAAPSLMNLPGADRYVS